MKSGICYLVGAGPGDPLLMTLKGRDCLARADVVVYDNLCNPAIVQIARPHAEKIFAGKSGSNHTIAQDEINAILVSHTKAGKCVVRLKGGDPFLFGRGGEEAEALVAARCRFEVVPGVTSAIAGPAYAGIPVTHRAHGPSVTIFSGHQDPSHPDAVRSFELLARAPGTKVMLMGLERLGGITAGLARAGMSPATPVALIRQATTARQQTLLGTLANIANRATTANFQPPALAVFGESVRLRDALNWFESLPLFGKRIAVTRAHRQAGKLVHQLQALGADAFEMPTIRIEPTPDKREFYEMVAYAHTYEWIVFTSQNGVDAFFEAFYELYHDARAIGGVRIAAIGPATAARIRDFRLAVDVQPAKAVAEEVVKALQDATALDNTKILFVRAEGARNIIPLELSRLGAIVDQAVAYRTIPEPGDPDGGIHRYRSEGADLVTFTSASSAENFHALQLPAPEGVRYASIGPVTSMAMRQLGLPVALEAHTHDIPGLVDEIVKFYNGRPACHS